ncbi:hypothetical protein GQ53DRAFT_766280 [Thozetella sp. PMI_491]|nr:hypothetical protein GQ53DRAFT_766280 [Thozetella sp. PMI_491]
MPISTDFALPDAAKRLELPGDANSKLFVCFIASTDPVTKQAWCPDVRVALPVLKTTFSGSNAPELALIEVGQRPEWRAAGNIYRKNFDVHSVPTLVRFQRVNGEVKEVGRLVEAELLDEKKLHTLMA